MIIVIIRRYLYSNILAEDIDKDNSCISNILSLIYTYNVGKNNKR